jgi:hypothetical protein
VVRKAWHTGVGGGWHGGWRVASASRRVVEWGGAGLGNELAGARRCRLSLCPSGVMGLPRCDETEGRQWVGRRS